MSKFEKTIAVPETLYGQMQIFCLAEKIGECETRGPAFNRSIDFKLSDNDEDFVPCRTEPKLPIRGFEV